MPVALLPVAASDEKYASYLQVVYDDHSQPFDELQSIIARYLTLHQTNTDLLAAQQRTSGLCEQHRTAFAARRKERHNDILQLTNEVALWSAEYERVERERREVEGGMEVEEQQYEQRQREVIQLVLGTDNLHTRCKHELKAIRRHGETQQTADGQQDAAPLLLTQAAAASGSAAVLRLQREVETKLAEIAEYVVDLQDIVESVGGCSVEGARMRAGHIVRAQRDRDKQDKEETRELPK